jgi:surfeit locus 1 family protein
MMLQLVEQPAKRGSLVLAGAMTLAGLALLIALGTWQLSRRAEKLDLIAQIEAMRSAAPVPLDRAVAAWRKGAGIEYLRVKLSGRFLVEHERYLFATENGKAGWHVYTPLSTGFQHVVFAPKLVMVNRGFVPDELRDPGRRAEVEPPGPVTIIGFLRRPPEARSAFENENDQAANRWFWRDLQGMAASIPREKLPRHAPFLPFFVEAEASPGATGWPRGGATRLEIPNRHLEYALTWYGLAATLGGVFGVWAWGRVRAIPMSANPG